jgi:hypothetical protein
MSEATKEVIYLGRLLMELLGQPVQKVMYCDNQGAISLAQNPVFHKRTKHIAIRYHFVRDAVNNNEFTIVHSPTNKMVADFLTKSLPKPKHVWCRTSCGLISPVIFSSAL